MLIDGLRSDNCLRLTSKHMHGDSRLWISGNANCFDCFWLLIWSNLNLNQKRFQYKGHGVEEQESLYTMPVSICFGQNTTTTPLENWKQCLITTHHH